MLDYVFIKFKCRDGFFMEDVRNEGKMILKGIRMLDGWIIFCLEVGLFRGF